MTDSTATETTAPYAVEAIRDAKGKARGWTIVSTDDDPLMILVDGEPFQVKSKAEATEALEALLEGELDGFDYDADAPAVPTPDEVEGMAAADEPVEAPKAKRRTKAQKEADEATAKANADAIRSMSDADLAVAIEQAAENGSDLHDQLVSERDRRTAEPTTPKVERPSRVRLGEAGGTPAVQYDPAEKFPAHVEVIGEIRERVAELREALNGSDKAQISSLNDQLNDALARAYQAGLPITALGVLIGVSASAARSRALRAAAAKGLDVSERTSAEGQPVARKGSTIPVVALDAVTAKVRGRYGKQLEDIHAQLTAAHEAGDEDAFNGAMFGAMEKGVSIVALGQLLAVSASAARSRALRYATRHGKTLPSKDDRKAARTELAGALADEG